MGFKSFLKPDWRKFILPAALIVMFLTVLNSYYAVAGLFDRYTCDMVSLGKQLNAYHEQNNTVSYNKTTEKVFSLINNMKTEGESLNLEQMLYISNFISVIDPINPFPCELSGGMGEPIIQSGVCEFYITKRTFDCQYEMDNNNNPFFETPNYTYHGASVFLPALNILLLFAEGYLISCAALLGYGKIRSRKKQPKQKMRNLIPLTQADKRRAY